MAERILTGVKELDDKLKRLERKSANKAARAGLSKGARLAAKQIKAEIPSSQKDIRKAIGSSVKKSKGGATKGTTQAKAGAAVGKSRAKAKDRGNKPGVGISRQNIHWWIMGTDERTQKTTGIRTGRMPAHPVVAQAVAKGKGAIASAIKDGTKAALIREAKKK